MASSPPSWLALDKTLRVSADQGDGFSIHRAKPPLLSHLIISAQPQAAASPLVDVLAADLCAQPQAAARPRVDVLAADLSAGLFLLPATPPSNTGYTVLDAASPNNTYRVPGHTVSGVDLGVISGSLACWVTKEVDNPLAARAWTFVDVIAHDGRLWWVHTASTDGASGLLSCDPFDDKPEIVFSAGYDVRCPRCFHVPLAARRCVQVAEGKLRWVQTTCEHTDALGAPSVFMLTLDDDATATAEWTMSFADLWADDSYKSTELPKVEPALAFIHPKVSSVVYFSLGKCLFGVDMRAREMVAYSTDSDVSSLLAWVLPTAAAPQV
ncbi:hypothetical protein BS78_09G179900 [Paspalum vaginatum]|nr:hypothetical protein BS78_09G179900 [Paspalum vaginatum]